MRTLGAAPSNTLDVATKGYVDTATGLLVPKSLVDAKGDLLVGTAADTVARKAVGNNNDPLVGDSASSDGLRWDVSRGADLWWLREAQNIIGANCPGYGDSTLVLAMSASVRTVQTIVCKARDGAAIASIKFRTTVAMTGGAGSIALYGASSLNATTWNRLGSAVTITSDLQATAGRKSVAYSTTVSGDQWIRAVITLTSTPSAYPTIALGLNPFDSTLVGGHQGSGVSNSTASPPSTIDPSTGWTTLAPWWAVAIAA